MCFQHLFWQSRLLHKIVALFDNDPIKCGEKSNPPIFPIEKLYEFVGNNNIDLGVIAVPYFAAQQILDLMILAGIKGVLNFAPIYLKAPKDFFINDMNLRLELETVAYFIKSQKSKWLLKKEMTWKQQN